VELVLSVGGDVDGFARTDCGFGATGGLEFAFEQGKDSSKSWGGGRRAGWQFICAIAPTQAKIK
jgi:hypothetical protein